MAVEPPLVAAAGWDELHPLIQDRKRAGITQAQLAVALGLCDGTLNRKERGTSATSAQFRRKYRAKLDHLIELKARRAAKAA